MSATDPGFVAAVEQAKISEAEGGIPIGACLVAADGKILGKGHNLRLQRGSATMHAEIAAFENAGRLPASAYKGATVYTTLSPCDMCTGACLLYSVARVVIGENRTFAGLGADLLRQRGVEVVMLQDQECLEMMSRFMEEKAAEFSEDIGEVHAKA